MNLAGNESNFIILFDKSRLRMSSSSAISVANTPPTSI